MPPLSNFLMPSLPFPLFRCTDGVSVVACRVILDVAGMAEEEGTRPRRPHGRTEVPAWMGRARRRGQTVKGTPRRHAVEGTPATAAVEGTPWKARCERHEGPSKYILRSTRLHGIPWMMTGVAPRTRSSGGVASIVLVSLCD